MIDNTINDDKTIAGGEDMILAGRYHILRRLGQGGMGAVWLAEDRQLDNRKVAIKMLPSIVVTDKRAYQQLKSEALVSLKLIHPNIVTLRAFEENKGAPFLVMDYIEGRTLSDYLAEKGKLSESETIKLLKPIAAALDYAHGEKVIHRDVKPSNIIIRNDGHPFILDFGIAREIQESMTRVTGRTISGTLLYMSPEQLRGAPPAPAQDVYSFAAMCYECLSGNPPFTRGNVAYQIVNEEPVSLKGDKRLVSAVMAGLAKKPSDRPNNCAILLYDDTISHDDTDNMNVSYRASEKGSWLSTATMYKLVPLLLLCISVSIVVMHQFLAKTFRHDVEFESQTVELKGTEFDNCDTYTELHPQQVGHGVLLEEESKTVVEISKVNASTIRSKAVAQADRVACISDADGFGGRKVELSDLLLKADVDYSNRQWMASAHLYTNYLALSSSLIALDEARNLAVTSRNAAITAKVDAEAEEADKYAAEAWEACLNVWREAVHLFDESKFAKADNSFVRVANMLRKCKEEAVKNAGPTLKVISSIDGKDVVGAMVFDGTEDCKTPVEWQVEKGQKYGPHDVVYVGEKKKYKGQVPAFVVDWKGRKVVAVQLEEVPFDTGTPSKARQN